MNEVQLTIKATLATYDIAKTTRIVQEEVKAELMAALAKYSSGTFLLKQNPVIGVTYDLKEDKCAAVIRARGRKYE